MRSRKLFNNSKRNRFNEYNARARAKIRAHTRYLKCSKLEITVIYTLQNIIIIHFFIKIFAHVKKK